jgi:hypothetical protein
MTPDKAILPAQADLRYLLDLQPGQSSALIYMGTHLQNALQNEGLHVHYSPTSDTLPDSTKFDSIFLAPHPEKDLGAVLQECANSLRPGGQMLLCFCNQSSIKRIINTLSPKNNAMYSLYTARNAVKAAGLKVRGIYGVHDNIEEPRFLIPLENKKAIAHFFGAVLVPYTAFTRFLTYIAPLFIFLNLHPLLFTDLCLVLESPC